MFYIVKDRAGRRSKSTILQGVSGYLKPGEMAAIMGPSGSGDSPVTDLCIVGLPSAFTQADDSVPAALVLQMQSTCMSRREDLLNRGRDMLCSLKLCMQMHCRKVHHSGFAGREEDCG